MKERVREKWSSEQPKQARKHRPPLCISNTYSYSNFIRLYVDVSYVLFWTQPLCMVPEHNTPDIYHKHMNKVAMSDAFLNKVHMVNKILTLNNWSLRQEFNVTYPRWFILVAISLVQNLQLFKPLHTSPSLLLMSLNTLHFHVRPEKWVTNFPQKAFQEIHNQHSHSQ